MTLAPGQMATYAVRGELGENGGGGDGHVCTNEVTVVTNCIPAELSMKPIVDASQILVPQMGVYSTSVFVGAQVTVVTNGFHDIIETIQPCPICNQTPNPNVSTNRVPIPSPTTFQWEKTIAPYDTETFVGPACYAIIFTVSEPGNRSVAFSATAVQSPPCNIEGICNPASVSASTNLLVMQLESEAAVELPPDRKRRLFGVGEDVILRMLPLDETDATEWEITGGKGKFDNMPAIGNTIKFEAPDKSDTTTITATINGKSAFIQFAIIPPMTVTFISKDWESDPGGSKAPPRWHYYVVKDFFLGYRSDVYVGPDSVNFYKTKAYEGESPMYSSGSMTQVKQKAHPPNGPHGFTQEVYPGRGTRMGKPDENTGFSAEVPCGNGNAHWLIDWDYSVGSGSRYFIQQVQQNWDLIMVDPPSTNGTFRATKGSSGAEISTGQQDGALL